MVRPVLVARAAHARMLSAAGGDGSADPDEMDLGRELGAVAGTERLDLLLEVVQVGRLRGQGLQAVQEHVHGCMVAFAERGEDVVPYAVRFLGVQRCRGASGGPAWEMPRGARWTAGAAWPEPGAWAWPWACLPIGRETAALPAVRCSAVTPAGPSGSPGAGSSAVSAAAGEADRRRTGLHPLFARSPGLVCDVLLHRWSPRVRHAPGVRCGDTRCGRSDAATSRPGRTTMRAEFAARPPSGLRFGPPVASASGAPGALKAGRSDGDGRPAWSAEPMCGYCEQNASSLTQL